MLYMGRVTRSSLWIVVAIALLGGCAHSAPEPEVRDAITAEENIGDYTHLLISSQTNPGVFVPDHDRANVVSGVKREIHTRAPNRYVFVEEDVARTVSVPADAAVDAPKTLRMHIIFTRFDEGNAFARFMLAGLGQIRLDTHVTLSDFGTGTVIGEYDVSKQFALGGIYGASTDMQDVEQGLSKGIADILIPEPAQSRAPERYPE